jgi:hypothetical protein
MKDPLEKWRFRGQTEAPRTTVQKDDDDPSLIRYTPSGKPGMLVQAVYAGDPQEPLKRAFGPFLNVPVAEIHLAGFDCFCCKRPVERFRQVVPHVVPRMCFYTCRCGGCIVVWEDERQPNDSKIWDWNMKLLKQAGADLAIFNGNKPLSPGFSGCN